MHRTFFAGFNGTYWDKKAAREAAEAEAPAWFKAPNVPHLDMLYCSFLNGCDEEVVMAVTEDPNQTWDGEAACIEHLPNNLREEL